MTDNVLVIEYCPSPQSGGAERSMRALCEHLAARGNKVYIGYKDEGEYLKGSAGRIYSGHLKLNIPVLTAPGGMSFLKDIAQTRRFCRAHGVSAIITHVVHAAPFIRACGTFNKVKTGMLLKWRLTTDRAGIKVRWGMAGINRHVAVSNYTLDYWKRSGVPAETSSVVPEGVAPWVIKPEPRKGGSFHVAFAGRIVHMKGLHLLLQAIEKLRKEGQGITLSIAGGFRGKNSPAPDPYHCALEDQVAKADLQDAVTFLGFVDPVEALFARADLVVVPSILPEAQPLAIMQAMAAGALVLSSDIGGVSEVLKADFSEFMVAAGEVGPLYAKIKEFSSWPAEKRAEQGARMKAFVIRNYNLNLLLEKTANQLNIT